ncbi:MAG: isopentenyl-diphosphate Delta-isomerase [Oscillospiraceae bacterium]
MSEVILVDMDDRPIGHAEKMYAHEKGLLHRAFSVFLFNGDKLLLQKRAAAKYHCGGKWTNTCCSHPGENETVIEAALRRLDDELGISVSELREAGCFVYRFPFENGLTEFEYDHILVGEYDGGWTENPEEVECAEYADISSLKQSLLERSEAYTPWFITALKYAIKVHNEK